ncbi:MAG TPA: hypothetical protein ENI59_00555 [Euryarchaeota archaeon]|nr:hypothetical protein [Euryarchaeota archaeon]
MNEYLYNGLIAIAQFLYTIFIVLVTDALVKRKVISQSLSRKIVHMWAGGMVLFWPLYTGNTAPCFFCITPGIWICLLLYVATTKGPDDPTVRSMTRSGDPKELLRGVLYFPLMTIILTLIFWRSESLGPEQFPALAGIVAVGFGDGIAPILGQYSKKHFEIWKGTKKSFLGSLGMFLGSFIGILVFTPIVLGYVPKITHILIISILATLVEFFSPKDVDNLLIAFFTAGFAYFFL